MGIEQIMPQHKAKYFIQFVCSEIIDDMRQTCAPFISKNHFLLKLVSYPGAHKAIKSYFGLSNDEIPLLANISGAACLEDYGPENADADEKFLRVMDVVLEITEKMVPRLPQIKDKRAEAKRDISGNWTLSVK